MGRALGKPDSNISLIINGLCEMLCNSLCESQLPLLVNKSISIDILMLTLNETIYMQHFERNKGCNLFLNCTIYFTLSMERASAKHLCVNSKAYLVRKVNLKAWCLCLLVGGAGEGGGMQEMGLGLTVKKTKDSSHASLLNITSNCTSDFYVKIK